MNYAPLPKDSDHNDQTNVWASAQPNGMVSLHINDTTVTGTWMDAALLVYTIMQTVIDSAKQLGVSGETFEATITEIQRLVDSGYETSTQWK